MNLMDTDRRKKQVLIGVSVASLLTIVVLLIVFWEKLPFNEEPEPDQPPEQPEDYDPSGTGGLGRPEGDYYPLDDKQEVVIPNLELTEVHFEGYEDNGINRVMKVKDKEGNLIDFSITQETIFFDVEKNRAVRGNEVSKKDKIELSALANTDPNVKNKAVTVTLNNKTNKKLHYTPVITAEKTETHLYIVNPETNIRYKVDRNATFTNALSGDTMYDTDILHGDRLFIYEGETEVFVPPSEYTEGMHAPPGMFDKDPIGKNGELFPTQKERDLKSKDMKTIEVEQVFVYPNDTQ